MERPTREDLELCARAAQACARNAHDLAVEAGELLQSGRHARALALAIASLEEDGKHSAFMRQATEFDPEFLARLGGRSHPTMRHPVKQQTALKSLRNVFGPSPAGAYIGQIPNTRNPIATIDLDRVGDEIAGLREAALYVDVSREAIRSPSEISSDEAEQYVTLALSAASARQWVHRSDAATVADFLEAYRAIYLRNGGPDIRESLPAAVEIYRRIEEEVFSEFELLPDRTGHPATLRRRLPDRA